MRFCIVFCFVLGCFETIDEWSKPSRLYGAEMSHRETKKMSATKMKATLNSGRAVGEYVPTFYSRAVTGPLMNKSICYVCRNGARPVVMILMRRVEPEWK